jgi:capsular polysaccharide biosynthesis protein
MSLVQAELILPQDYCRQRGYPFLEISAPRPLLLRERGLSGEYSSSDCRLAHAYVARVDDARGFGPGFLVTGDGHCLLHGLSHANYSKAIKLQLQGYLAGKIAGTRMPLEIPDGRPFLDDEAVLLWGSANFGHWLWNYLHRLTLLSRHPQLRDLKIVVLEETPARYTAWLARMGIAEDRVVRLPDCSRVARLWVPSVPHYRGHYEDGNVYTWPEAVHLFREAVLGARAASIPPGEKRERIYVSRDKAQWRKAVNEDELTAMLEPLGVRRVFLEDLSVDEQIDLVSRAELIVLMAGGASPVTMLAPRDASIVEVCLAGFSGIFGSRLWAQILGQGFARVDATPVETRGPMSNPATDRNAHVPVSKVRELVLAADRQRARDG